MSMKKMRKATMAAMVFLGCVCAPVAATVSYAQLTDAQGNAVESDTSKQTTNSGGGFYDIVFGSGIVGMLLWFALFADGAMAIYFAVDCYVLIKPAKLMPNSLITNVQNAMADSIDLSNRLNDAINGILQDLQSSSNGFGVGGHGDVLNDLVLANLVVQTAINANTLTQTLSGNDTSLGVHQLVLEGRGTSVDNQNVHGKLPPKNNVSFFLRL